MKSKLVIVLAITALLAGCSTVPKERTSNCACNWEELSKVDEGNLA